MRSSDTVLILSQDYELFFGNSGSAERCLLEPTDALLTFARQRKVEITFYVDAGMLVAMREHAKSAPRLSQTLDKILFQLQEIVRSGHEIGLHVHPHWHETRYADDAWDFSATRYKLSQFSAAEACSITREYHAILAEKCDFSPVSYRAGGFCTDSFPLIADTLQELGVDIDSSIVPGARLHDASKGFDFSGCPDRSSWRFESDPVVATSGGRFIEVPVSPVKLPVFYYWGRLFQRLSGNIPTGQFGDGSSKTFNRAEAIRRLLGLRRVAEMSADLPKVLHLERARRGQSRNVFHIMGHPKLLSSQSIKLLTEFIDRAGISESHTVEKCARRIYSQAPANP
tara:strand:- start:5489 stop:6511 length:1023 start_codon:yes stop_codon:yes gene_type:complete